MSVLCTPPLLLLLAPFSTVLNLVSLLLHIDITVIRDAIEIAATILPAVDYLSLAIFLIQFAIVVKVTARAMGYGRFQCSFLFLFQAEAALQCSCNFSDTKVTEQSLISKG